MFSYLDHLESIGTDAVIIQDRGLLQLIRNNFSIPIHASTQMGIHSSEGVVWAEKNGVSRVILAREIRMKELEKIREVTKLELEIFVHGALCYSFSGQCLFSSTLGGRSGNRGTCAQPCRKQYTLRSQKGYLLSTADIFGIDLLPDLLRIGIDGVKIEGRMRSPLYVYLTSKIYANAIRRAEAGKRTLITSREKEVLEIVFNRGFSKGYLVEDNVMQRAYAGSRGLFLGKVDFDGKNIAIKADNLGEKDGVTLYRLGEKVGGFEIKKIEKKNGFLILYPPFKIPEGKYHIYKTKDREFDSMKRRIKGMPFSLDSVEKKIEKRQLSRINGMKPKANFPFMYHR